MVNFKTVRKDFDTVRKNLGDPRKLGLGEFPQGTPAGTVPIGDGWYATPTTPADPQDCDRYPDSPWCGGNPLTAKPVDLSVDAQVHGCGWDIEVAGAIAFIKVPPARLSYRYEGECRNEPPPWTPPPPPGFFPGMPPPETPFPGGIGDDEMVVVGISYSYYHYIAYFGTEQHPEPAIGTDTGNTTGATLSYPGSAIAHYYGHADMPAFASISFGRNVVGTRNDEYIRRYGDLAGSYTFQDQFNMHPAQETNGTGVIKFVSRGYNNDSNISNDLGEQDAAIFWGRYADVKEAFKEEALYDVYSDNVFVSTTILTPSVVGIYVIPGPHNGQPRTPYDRNPPPPDNDDDDPDKDCCMSCCPDYSSLLKQLLAEIKKANKAIGSDSFPVSATIYDEDENKQQAQSKSLKLKTIAESITKIIDRNEKISKIIGIDTFPLELPESVIIHPESNILQKALNFLNPFKNTKIYSVMDLLVWKIKQDSAVLGQWGQTIKVQSTEKKKVMVDGKEIEKDVEKTEEVILPNMAQTMKEQILLQSQQMKTMGMALDCIVKLLIDVAQAKAISAETVRRVEDIQQYLDYPTNEKTVDVPVQITFPNPKDPKDVQNDIFKLLQEGKITITYDDWTGEHSQDEKLLDLLQAAKTIQGVYFSKS